MYLRPFNFRSDGPVRRDHAVQYVSVPDFDWPRLRKEFPQEFENHVDQSPVPTDRVRLRIVVDGSRVRIYAGQIKTATLFSRSIIGLSLTALFAFATVPAQSSAITGAIRCESCAPSGQKPEPFDPGKTDVVPRVEPVLVSGALIGSAGPETPREAR